MANNRIAYGLAKKYGINTKGMEPVDVWKALNEKGITKGNADEERKIVVKWLKGKKDVKNPDYWIKRAQDDDYEADLIRMAKENDSIGTSGLAMFFTND